MGSEIVKARQLDITPRTTAQIATMTEVAGTVAFNSDFDILQIYNGTSRFDAWLQGLFSV